MMRRTPLRRTKSLVRSSPLPKEGTSKPKRQARYKAYLASKVWRGKPDGVRWRTLVHFDFTCQCGCEWRDESETGAELDAHHDRYPRELGTEVPGVHTFAYRRDHHQREEKINRWWRRRAS